MGIEDTPGGKKPTGYKAARIGRVATCYSLLEAILQCPRGGGSQPAGKTEGSGTGRGRGEENHQEKPWLLMLLEAKTWKTAWFLMRSDEKKNVENKHGF